MQIWNEPWFWPAAGVIIGLPIILLVLTELQSLLERQRNRAAKIVLLLRNYVAPVGALLLLLNQATYADIDLTWTQVTATVFGFLIILVLLNGLNYVIFVTARQGTWRSKVPSIFVDIVRVILIVVCLAILFSIVWNADVGGFFTALGVGSIVIGLSLQNAVGSVVSGLFLLFEQPFSLNDWIEVDGLRGQIVEVNWRAVHLKDSSGVHIIPNATLAGSTFLNISRSDSPFEATVVLRFSSDDAPQDVIDTCVAVAADLPTAMPGEPASVKPIEKSKYVIDIPVRSPADNYKTMKLFRTHIWYAARRAGLHLDGNDNDTFNSQENVHEAVERVASALYLGHDDIEVVAHDVRLERYGEGETIQRAGEVPTGMRYIISGAATLSVTTDEGTEVTFAVLDRDDVLGLTALTRQGVAATARAISDLALLYVPVSVLDALVKTRPQLARDVGLAIDHRASQAKAAFEAAGVVSTQHRDFIS
ncbi:small-conductance mechanosensitive channel [Microbacteriaceae bacterium SG_E_30_P1]|uniref:Small-conductance mechanosensitive channel n=1 Tax=Antiquaquibacter oligotrophicus TaxID=2880260 RepID=A0ABT6KS76_9MICO|nr:mechanosensitive ion channel family protein [Antiquaquibacter oligotrophicus]MDH6181932.1 small-conductance mechanosensitive channel [Antiquaquibacter oligotrophicus]UDF12397.1 mechanosensitive ion channel family protein [Antiquaquibacter oligotrophicus]